MSSDSPSEFLNTRRNAGFEFDIAVVGLGYVGLPVAIAAAEAGCRVFGFDVDEHTIDLLQQGRSHIEDISCQRVADVIRDGATFAGDASLLARAASVIIAVPTPLADGSPDLSAVRSAAETIGHKLVPGQLVVLESTTYPGTTDEVLVPLLESGSGLVAGRDFAVGYSPERIDPGNSVWTLENTPKLVAGADVISTELVAELYGRFCETVIPVAGTREAEMAKLLENTYRHVNIALVNEMAVFCHELGVDIWEVIRAAATKPFGFQPFYPGPGVGGHCIPIDPNYLSYRVRQLGYPFRFVELASEINTRMPVYVVDRLALMLNELQKAINGSSVLLVGVAYKPDVSDVRESPAIEVIRRLRTLGADISYVDPHVSEVVVDGVRVDRAEDALAAAAEHDATVLLTPHRSLDLEDIASKSRAFLDTRGVVDSDTVTRL